MEIIPFERSFASHEKSQYWNSELNGNINPNQVYKSSNKKFWFDCVNCNHVFQTAIYSITGNGSVWCPYCSNQKLCDDLNCKLCEEKSFLVNEKSLYWNSELNGNITPRKVFKSSNKKYYFDCPNCNHTFDIVLNCINRGQFCPYCSNPPRKICNDETCQHCYNKSFASHEKSMYWSSLNGEKNPRQYFKSSIEKIWFNCSTCKHTFQNKLNNITNGNQWCPYCSIPAKQLCDNIECQVCFERSFASHEKSKYWSNKNEDITPRQVLQYSNKKFWFECESYGHLFQVTLSHITNSGCWCPKCKNKTELKLYNALVSNYPTIIQQFRVDWCKNKNNLPYDFCIPEHKIIIELDGPQHFKQILNWKSPDKSFENDKFKGRCANENNYSVIRIIQEDVFYDKYDWLTELRNTIQEIINTNDTVNKYICKNDEYKNFLG